MVLKLGHNLQSCQNHCFIIVVIVSVIIMFVYCCCSCYWCCRRDLIIALNLRFI
jgi:hypothetical protein